jgi:hypothetical protein
MKRLTFAFSLGAVVPSVFAASTSRELLEKYVPIWTGVLLAVLSVVGFICLVKLATGKHKYLLVVPIVTAALAFWRLEGPCPDMQCRLVSNLIAVVPLIEAFFFGAILAIVGVPIVREWVLPTVRFFLRWRQ